MNPSLDETQTEPIATAKAVLPVLPPSNSPQVAFESFDPIFHLEKYVITDVTDADTRVFGPDTQQARRSLALWSYFGIKPVLNFKILIIAGQMVTYLLRISLYRNDVPSKLIYKEFNGQGTQEFEFSYEPRIWNSNQGYVPTYYDFGAYQVPQFQLQTIIVNPGLLYTSKIGKLITCSLSGSSYIHNVGISRPLNPNYLITPS